MDINNPSSFFFQFIFMLGNLIHTTKLGIKKRLSTDRKP